MANFILIKRKGSNTYKGAIPAKAGISKEKLRRSVSKNLKPGLTFRIVSKQQLVNFLKKMKPRQRRKKKKR